MCACVTCTVPPMVAIGARQGKLCVAWHALRRCMTCNACMCDAIFNNGVGVEHSEKCSAGKMLTQLALKPVNTLRALPVEVLVR